MEGDGSEKPAKTELRGRAEAKLKESGVRRVSYRGEVDLERLVHELEVYQVEVEMLNDELKRAETNLERSEQGRRSAEARGTTLFDTVADAVVGSDASGRIEAFNRAAERLFGYTQAEVLGNNVRILMPSPHREKHDGYLERYLATGKARVVGRGRLEVLGLKKDGATFPLELGVGEWFEGKERKFVAVLHDLSDRRQAEADRERLQAQVLQTQKLEALGTLASGVAHDFSNLLMGIGGCTNIALSTLPADSSVRMYLEEIRKSTESGAAISRRLLDLARKKTGARLQVFELDPFIGGVRDLLAHMLTEDIDVVVRPAATVSRIRADPGLMEQVLVNLAANARDAMPEGGTLTLETKSVRMGDGNGHALPSGDYVLLTVSDTGVGMARATVKRAFEPFFSTKEVGKGTGLGLSMAHGIIEQAGGKIEIESAPNQGTRFRIFLPTTSAALTHDSAPPEDGRGLEGTGTVLLVEDDRAVRLGTRFYLEQAGYRVLEAGSGAEAIECCKNYQKPIDLLLSDVVLQGMGGQEIAREVRALKPGTRVIYMSAHPTEWLEGERRIEPGARTLEKPLGPSELLFAVKAVLEQAPMKPSQEVETSRGKVLVVEDQSGARVAIATHLSEAGWEVVESQNAQQALDLAHSGAHEFVALIIDYGLPSIKGDALASELKKRYPKAALVYMSGYPGLTLDPPGVLLTKPLALEAVSETLQRLLED